MFIPFFVLSVMLFVGVIDDDVINLEVPVFAIAGEGVDNATRSYFTSGTNNVFDEIVMTGLLVSLCFIALSKEKDEDEMTGKIRMESFVWSMWVASILLLIGIVFIYGFSFLSFTFFDLYAVFFLYILKFNIEMHKVRRGVE